MASLRRPSNRYFCPTLICEARIEVKERLEVLNRTLTKNSNLTQRSTILENDVQELEKANHDLSVPNTSCCIFDDPFIAEALENGADALEVTSPKTRYGEAERLTRPPDKNEHMGSGLNSTLQNDNARLDERNTDTLLIQGLFGRLRFENVYFKETLEAAESTTQLLDLGITKRNGWA